MNLAGVALAAGEGRRLRPLTALRPKPLCPIVSTTMLELALGRLESVCGAGPDRVAVNACHLADQIVAAVGDRATVSVESSLLGTAGALGRLREWIGGRDVLLTNADALLVARAGDLADAPANWTPISLKNLVAEPLELDRPRLLVAPPAAGQAADFVDGEGAGWRYVGVCLLPWELVRDLEPVPSGLFSTIWKQAYDEERLDLVPLSSLALVGMLRGSSGVQVQAVGSLR